jgi:hypothetical protein
MGIPEEVEKRIASWEGLSRWERSEVARDLRRLGLSYGEIRELIDVKKSTLATWCRDIALSESQKQAILERTGSRRGIPVDTQWRRREEVQRLQQEAGEEVARLVLQPGWVAGVVLYWAEGNKTQSNLGLANSDARIIRLFIDWCRQYHDPCATFALKLNLHAGNDEAAARAWVGHAIGPTQSSISQDLHQAGRHRPPQEPPSLRSLPGANGSKRQRLPPDAGMDPGSCRPFRRVTPRP